MISSSLRCIQQFGAASLIEYGVIPKIAAVLLIIAISVIAIEHSLRLTVPKGFLKIPGPRGLPVVGQSFSVPVDNPQTQFLQWADKYGEIFQIQLGFQKWVFLNSAEAAKEVIDKQSASSSSRPPMPSADIISGHRRMLLMPYGERWRNLRGIIHTMFTPKASEVFKPSQEFESKQLLADIAATRDDESAFYQHIRRYSTSVILTSTYGFRVPVWVCGTLHYRAALSQAQHAIVSVEADYATRIARMCVRYMA